MIYHWSFDIWLVYLQVFKPLAEKFGMKFDCDIIRRFVFSVTWIKVIIITCCVRGRLSKHPPDSDCDQPRLWSLL